MSVSSNVVRYKDAMLVTWEDGVDIVDTVTGKWRTAKSMRAAKWNISVWRRLCQEFKATPRDTPATE